jgi:hypothetical protein
LYVDSDAAEPRIGASDDRRVVTLKGCRAVELTVKISAHPPMVCPRMDDILSPSRLSLK